MSHPRVDDNRERSRYEVIVDGDTAALEYRLLGQDVLALVHTDVPEALRGKGVGHRLATHAMKDAQARSIRILPLCPFVAGFLQRHPEYRSLVSSRYRGFDDPHGPSAP